MKLIPYSRQSINFKDINVVNKVLKSSIITTGKEVEKFEKKINSYLKCKHSTVCNSGTSAIYLALNAIGLKHNENIIMPAINFVASHNISRNLGANIFLADVNVNTGQMSPEDVEECIKKFRIKKIKAVLTMYNGGYPSNIEKFQYLKKKYKCFIIEDACHAFGAKYKFKNKILKVGSCKHSDISTFSLHPLKTITTGEGGIVTTNSKVFNDRIKKIRTLGISRNKKKHWEYDVVYSGLNLRLNDFQCALGSSQLSRISSFIKLRKKIANKYNNALKDIDEINLPKHNSKYMTSYHLYLINFKKPNLKKKERLIKYMLQNRILVQYHYIPLNKFKIFKGKYITKNAKIYYKSTLSLPIYPDLSLKDQNYIIGKLKLFFKLDE